jgi:hypothetical protein
MGRDGRHDRSAFAHGPPHHLNHASFPPFPFGGVKSTNAFGDDLFVFSCVLFSCAPCFKTEGSPT